MSEISNTFCPAKWEEINFNFSYNYVFACCKSTPIKYENGNYKNILDKQKENLLSNVQDPSCNYCWKVENKNLASKRHEYLQQFDIARYELYKNNTIKPKLIELYIGNECNFQCTYCNPKYSSQWEMDVRKSHYKIFTDRYFYEIDEKQPDAAIKTLDFLNDLDKSVRLNILGGEPLLNKLFWHILDVTTVEDFFVSTNLSCKTKKEIDKLYQKSNKFKNLYINISIDSTKENAEFSRYGMNFELFEENLNYLLTKCPSNTKINICSVISSITVHDLKNFLEFIQEKQNKYHNFTWSLFPCIHPRIQSFETLSDEFKENATVVLQQIHSLSYTLGADKVISAMMSCKFNKTLFNELKVFLNDFSKRKKIEIPICLN